MIHYTSYGQNVTGTWSIRQSNGTRYGFEIETGWRSNSYMSQFFRALEAKNLDRYVMAKEDSSIHAAQDAEIVSRPLILPEAKRVAKRVIETFVAQPAPHRTLEGCGVHVHTTRAAWSKPALLMARRAIMGIDTIRYNAGPGANILETAHQDFWNTIATRPPNSYCKRHDSLEYERYAYGAGSDVLRMWNSWKENGDHFDSVSWSRRGPTIEFRLWGSSTKARTIASYLDAIDSLLRYCESIVAEQGYNDQTLITSLQRFSPIAFTEWLFKQSGYQALKWRIKNVAKIKNALAQCQEQPVRVETPHEEPVQNPFEEVPVLSSELDGSVVHGNGNPCPFLRGEETVCTCACSGCAQWNRVPGRHLSAREAVGDTHNGTALCAFLRDEAAVCTCTCGSCRNMNAMDYGLHAEARRNSCIDTHHYSCTMCRMDCDQFHSAFRIQRGF